MFYSISELSNVWKDSPQKAESLKGILQDPVMQEALDIIERTCAPTLTPDNVNHMVMNNAVCYGRLQAIRALNDLASPEKASAFFDIEEKKLKPEKPTLR